jgi:predicted helicase
MEPNGAPHMDNTIEHQIEDNFQLLSELYPGRHWAKMRLFWWHQPRTHPGVKACRDHWFYGINTEDLQQNINRYIKQYGIIEAYMYKPQENTNEESEKSEKENSSGSEETCEVIES